MDPTQIRLMVPLVGHPSTTVPYKNQAYSKQQSRSMAKPNNLTSMVTHPTMMEVKKCNIT
eukprot:3911121-Ditylum_brightwellii.AAC.1